MISRLRGWQLCAVSALVGGLGAFGQAPYDWPALMLAAMVVAAFLFNEAPTPRRAALAGFGFGLGYFLHALQWIVSPFMVDVARHGWMAPFALVFMAAGMALFWGLAFWAARWLSPVRGWPLVPCWAGVEVLRAYIFTGFPWASPAQATVDVLAGQGLAWVGPHGVNLLVVAAAVAIGVPARWAWMRRFGQGILAFPLAALMVLGIFQPEAALTDYTVRLIQPNAAQRDKWDPDMIPIFFQRQLEFTAAPPAEGQPTPDLVIWPESAIPWSLHHAQGALDEIAAAGGTSQVALGARRVEGSRIFNAMVALGPKGAIAQRYDKHHLVPFGEYIPFGDQLGQFGIRGLAARDGNGYSAGPGAALMDFGALGRALPLICYEAVFAHDVNAAPERPDFLIQITNDAWFGKAAGPRQHLAQARMRAIEQGLPLARAANTGISAMVDPYGRVLQALPLNAAGFVDAPLPAPLRPTLYARTGDLPVIAVTLLALFIAAGARWRRV
ncbi:apolipoprotein N-acyltransferase [Sulfitobacter sp. JB4-11]|uniref:apolipoprotein N-acyltransferase n=1 Tax=Sulfitobacter rhodophyticola TaxID=3238304 RepID=UPI003519B2BA